MDDPIKFVAVAIYLAAVIVQLLPNCYFGSRLSEESRAITRAIYASQWIDRNEKCKRTIRILTERSMRPMTVYAGGLFDLSLPTFLKVILLNFIHFIWILSLRDLFLVCHRFAGSPTRTLTCYVLWNEVRLAENLSLRHHFSWSCLINKFYLAFIFNARDEYQNIQITNGYMIKFSASLKKILDSISSSSTRFYTEILLSQGSM